MARDPNTAALYKYAKGWGGGKLSIIYPVLDKSFSLTGLEEPIKLDNFKNFVVQFRKNAEAAGGPGVESDDFMKFTNVIRRKVTNLKISELFRIIEHEHSSQITTQP